MQLNIVHLCLTYLILPVVLAWEPQQETESSQVK